MGTPKASHPFFTVGHSTRPIAAFLDLLKAAGVGCVADVRTVPRSRRNPQYNVDVLPTVLGLEGIRHEHIAALGGLRARQPSVPEDVNAFWQNQSFHNYADYALSDAFRDGLARLRDLAYENSCAIMCAETLWWQCHRRIVADYLIAAGDTVLHIVGPGHVDPARMTAAARPGPGETLTYPVQRASERLEQRPIL